MNEITLKKLGKFLVASHLCIAGSGCATSEKSVSQQLQPEPEAKPKATRFELSFEEWQHYKKPLGSRQDIYVKSYAEDELIGSRHAFIAWDFDHDGLYEMLESLDEQSKVEARFYDFNSDGLIDVEKLP